jgi:two-component system NtrC family sensor kinase
MIGDGRGTILYCNDAVRRLFGYEPGELVGRHGSILTGSGRTPDMSTFLDEVLPGRSSAERGPVELELVRRDGGRFVAELTFSTWNEAGERLFAIHVRDVSPRREAARQRTLLARAVEQARNAVLITDVDGTLRYVNAAFEEMTGYTRTEAVGRNPRMLKSGAHPASFYEDMWARLQAGETFHGEFTNRRKDGTEYRQRSLVFPIMDDDGATLSYVGIAEDVTRERRLEEQFRQAQKMEAVGQFAGGIAHDFNNVLTGILGNAELLVDAVADGEDRVHVRDIIAGAGRGAGLVRRLMALSREEAGERRSLSLAASVDEAVRTIRRMLPEHITVTVRHTHPPEALRCTLDDGALHQALMNLATNARDAMPRGGELELRTERVGQEAVVTVVDTGTGMTPEVVQRLFDPFFTTKERGKGTGLGMVMVLQFAEGHGGSVSVESEPGRGTAVELRIPVDAGSAPGEDSTTRESLAAPDGGAAAVRRTNGGGGRRRGTVVLAEDQEEVAQVARRALERMGLTVHLAADGARALEILRARRGEVDLVVSDLVMPHGGGVELYRAVADWPDAPRFLVTSGYAPKDMEGAQELLERVPFLPKPWRLSEFRGKVGELLEGC